MPTFLGCCEAPLKSQGLSRIRQGLAALQEESAGWSQSPGGRKLQSQDRGPASHELVECVPTSVSNPSEQVELRLHLTSLRAANERVRSRF